MSFRDCIIAIGITLIFGVIATWVAERIKPGVLLSPIKRFFSKSLKLVKRKYIYIPIVFFLLLFLVYKLCLQNIFFPQNKLVVALTNFHLVSGAETTDNNALISHLQDSLKVYKNDIELIDSVYPEVRDSTQARELGESVNAHIVIWGSIEKTSTEAEIIPHITIVQPLGKMKFEPRQPEPATTISIAELEQIAFRKRKAREITDIVLSILGLAKYRIEKYEESIEILEKIQNKNAEIFFYIGNSYIFLPKPGFLRGVALGDSVRSEKAVDNYKEALQINPDFLEAHNNLGILLDELKRYDEAEKEYKEALRINPDDAEVHNNLGVLLDELKRYPEAEKEYKEALRVKPNLAETHNNLGYLHDELKRYPEAEEEYKEALRINPDLAQAHYNLGILLYDLKRYAEAEKEYKKALRINPDLAQAHYNLGILLYDLKRYAEAEKEYKETLRINQDFALAHNNLGNLLHDLKRYEEAEKEYKEALRINPNYAMAHYNLGILLYDLKRYDEAEKEYKEALRINPDYANAHYNLGNLLKELKRYDEAEKEYKEALLVNPDLAEAHGNLGILLKSLNRKDEAKKEFEIARDLFRKQGREEDAKIAEGFLKDL
jgi:tetratricopeptide (TPR) repeat protein